MEKFYFLFLFLLSTAATSIAQDLGAIQDCCTAFPLQGPENIEVLEGNGTGDDNDPIGDCSCLTQPEINSFWFVFDALSTTELQFIITPLGGVANYDFAIFEGGCPCGPTIFGDEVFEVACETKPPPIGLEGEPTGMGDPAIWGFPGGITQFQPSITLEDGKTYYLVINNVTPGNTDGFRLEFAPSVDIGQLPKPGPPVTGPTMLCPGSEAQFLTGGNPLFTINWTVNGAPVPTLVSTPILNWDFPDPGTFEICAQLEIECAIKFDPSCITVEVEPIQPTILTDVICFPPGVYDAPDGGTLFAPGVYNYTFESYLGCDSTVQLTLTPAFGSLEIRSAIVCEGDCVEFEGETLCESNVYEETYTNQEGCDSTIQFNLIVVPLETIIDIEDTLSCKKTNVILDGSLSLGGADMIYIWTNSAGDTIDTDSITVVDEPGFYTLTTTSFITGDTCMDFNTIEVIGDLLPPEEVMAIGDTISCKVDSVMLMGSSITPGVTYSWSGPNGFSSFEQNPMVADTGTYVLTVTGENGCVDFASADVIEIIETVEATATGATIDCINSSVVINGNSPEPNVTYSWESPGGTFYNVQNPTVEEVGTYTLTVTDADGCTGTAEAEVDENTTLPEANAAANEMLNCNATAIFLSGAGSSFGNEFSYLWSTTNGNIVSGENTLTPTVNAAGTYTLLVTNSINGCTNIAEATVVESPVVTADISSQDDVKCFGENNGSAAATGGGGTGTYTYAWSNGASGANVSDLSEGVYVVTVSDDDGCTATASVTISQPTALAANATASPESSAGANDGTAAASPSGGTPGYTYEWSNGETTAAISDLAPGNYTVVITDENGCQTTQTVTVNEVSCTVNANIDKEDVSCNGDGNGTAVIMLENATEPFTFLWSNDSTTQTISGLVPGTYTVTATDANGCEVAASITITEPASLNVNATSTGLTLPNADDGTATAAPTGGTSPYSFEWSNGETDAAIAGLAPGDYTVVVTDENGCTESQTVTVEGFDCGVSVNLDAENVNCFGANDGQATALPSGGIPPFVYEWSNGGTTATIGNLPAGTYEVMVTDSTNCPATGQITITEPAELVLEVTNLVPADCGSDNGTATVTPDGGTPGYTYEWSNGETSPTIMDLAAGVYGVTVMDENGCTIDVELEIETDETSDAEPPVAIAQNLTIELDADGLASITAMDIDNGSSDNCGITSMVVDVSSFDCSNLGENTVTLTVTDVGGNMVSTTAVVTVEDNIAPTVSCPDSMVVAYCDPVAVFEVEADDNCSANLIINQTSGLPSGSEFPEGETTTQTFEVMDAAGNLATCSFTVEVSETMSVNASATDVSCFGEADGSASTAVMGGVPGYSYLWSNDSTGVSVNGLGPGTYTVTVTDEAGCEETEEIDITEPAALVTTLVNIVNETNSNQDGAVDVTVSGGTLPYTFEWADLDGNVLGTSEDISGLSAGTYQLFVTDANGCVSSSAYTIQMSTSTYDPTLNSRIRLFPNPSRGWVTIELIEVPVTEIEIEVYDVVGKLAYMNPRADVKAGKFMLDLTSFPEGVYIIKLTVDGQVVTNKLVRGL